VYILLLFIFSYRCISFWYLENMVEESSSAEVIIIPKFDMQCHESLMTTKDVKKLGRKYNVLLDLHPCAPMDIKSLTEKIIDLRLVPPGLLFGAGLATTWVFSQLFPCVQRYQREW
ncbi:hypothetical protein Tco_1495383, partial [Tanacetum coccineum]